MTERGDGPTAERPGDPREGVVVDGVAVEEALRLLGDRALLERLLRLFAATWADGGARVRAALDAEGPAAAAEVAHAVRGVAANLAAEEVRAAAADLEQRLRAGGDVAPAIDTFERALARVILGIRRALGEETT